MSNQNTADDEPYDSTAPLSKKCAEKVPFFSTKSPRAKIFFSVFASFFVLSLLHRLIALAIYAEEIAFEATYFGYNKFDRVVLFGSQYGESAANGLRADALFSLAAALILTFLPRFIHVVALVATAIFYAGNLEHVRYNLTSFDLTQMHRGADPTFVMAQLTPDLALHFASFILTIGACLVLARFKIGQVLAVASAWVVLPIALIPVFPWNISQARWIQTHPLVPVVRASNLQDDQRNFSSAPFETSRLRQRLGNTPDRNLLLIYLEGVSQVSIDKAEMSYLRELGAQHTQFTRYFAHQLITTNGLYSTLTGEVPLFMRRDLLWDDLQAGDAVAEAALPNQLRRHGYHTAFIQSADTTYMQKNRVLPLVGFDVLVGDETAEHSYSRNGWGVDDRALFERVIEHIDSLKKDQPWMIASLTTGTHSPYNVPSDFLPDEASIRIRALRYADQAVSYLIEALKERDLFDNTVVVITSDESRELSGSSPIEDEIALSWLPLIILSPDTPKQEIDDYIMTSKLPELMFGLLDSNKETAFPVAQSPLVFGNLYSGRVLWLDADSHELFACQTLDFACGLYENVQDLGDLSDATPVRAAFYPKLRSLIQSRE